MVKSGSSNLFPYVSRRTGLSLGVDTWSEAKEDREVEELELVGESKGEAPPELVADETSVTFLRMAGFRCFTAVEAIVEYANVLREREDLLGQEERGPGLFCTTSRYDNCLEISPIRRGVDAVQNGYRPVPRRGDKRKTSACRNSAASRL
jgi:hypothetical protein